MAMKKTLFYILTGAMLVSACDETQAPDDKKATPSPSAQSAILWPSLASSPWPMHQHDPQGTGRSDLPGPTAGVIEWTFTLPSGSVGEGMAMLGDTVLLLTGGNSYFEVSLTSQQLKTVPIAHSSFQDPVICADGSLYLGLMTMVKNDSLKYSNRQFADIRGIQVGLDRTLYQLYLVNGIPTLEAKNSDGTTKWKITDTRFQYHSNSIVFSPDGKQLYVPGLSGQALVYAVDAQTGAVLWGFGRTTQDSPLSPMVDNAGRVYILGADTSYNNGSPSLFCVSSSGSLVWSYAHGNAYNPYLGAPPTMDHNGNVYFAFNALYSVSYEGALRWKADMPAPRMFIDKPLVCDKNNVIYASLESYGVTPKMMAYSSEGARLWECEIPHSGVLGDASPMIAPGGRLIVSGKAATKYFSIR